MLHGWWQAWRSELERQGAMPCSRPAALAVGIGAATAIYSVVNTAMLKPLPYRDGERFVAIFGADMRDPGAARPAPVRGRADVSRSGTGPSTPSDGSAAAGKNMMIAGEPYHVEGVAVTVAPGARQLGVPADRRSLVRGPQRRCALAAPCGNVSGADSAMIGQVRHPRRPELYGHRCDAGCGSVSPSPVSSWRDYAPMCGCRSIHRTRRAKPVRPIPLTPDGRPGRLAIGPPRRA